MNLMDELGPMPEPEYAPTFDHDKAVEEAKNEEESSGENKLHISEDVIQETMVRLSATLREKRYDAKRGRFRTFLCALANNLVVDILRRRTRFADLPLDTVDWVSPRPADAPVLALLDRQWQEACYKAARRHVLHHVPLPPHYADVWRALAKGETPAAIAARLGVTPTFVRQVKHRISTLISTTVATYGHS